MYILAISEKTRVPVQVHIVKILEDLIVVHPEGSRQKRSRICIQRTLFRSATIALWSSRAGICPWILDEQLAISITLSQIKNGIIMSTDEALKALFARIEFSRPQSQNDISVLKGSRYTPPQLIWRYIFMVKKDLLRNPTGEYPQISA